METSDPLGERWLPYQSWVESLDPDDTILTFNYDSVPNYLLAKPIAPDEPARLVTDPAEFNAPRESRLWIPTPDEIATSAPKKPVVLKLHGSVDWMLYDGAIKHASKVPCAFSNDPNRTKLAVLYCNDNEIGIATPGPTKYERVQEAGALKPLWDYAAEAIKKALAIVFVGYRIPPTDAYSRKWLTENIRKRAQGTYTLRLHTVLGDNIHSTDSTRLKGVLESLKQSHTPMKPSIQVDQHPMFAEDFLGLVARDDLFFRPKH